MCLIYLCTKQEEFPRIGIWTVLKDEWGFFQTLRLGVWLGEPGGGREGAVMLKKGIRCAGNRNNVDCPGNYKLFGNVGT